MRESEMKLQCDNYKDCGNEIVRSKRVVKVSQDKGWRLICFDCKMKMRRKEALHFKKESKEEI
jgi:hypothetical protein